MVLSLPYASLEMKTDAVADALPERRICEGHKDLPSCKVVLEAIKFEEKPSCVKMILKVSIFSSPRAST